MTCAILAAAVGCARTVRPDPGPAAVIRIAGSDTMQPLVQMWAESFMQLHPGVSMYTEGGGSGRGFAALIEGNVDLAAGSRAMQADEIKRLLDNRGFLGQSILTAKDALSVYLHPSNRVRDLSLGQLRGILEGEIRNWQEVGGRDAPIDLISRQPNSGTYSFLQQHILEGRPYGSIAQTAPHTSAVVELVAANPNALGYGGVAYGPDLIHCRIDGVEPTPENVRDGSYPLARYLYLFAAGPLEGHIRDFVNWVLSDEAQRIVSDVGYIPLWEVDPGN
jgi:phosphate transport system substrate-binding protein